MRKRIWLLTAALFVFLAGAVSLADAQSTGGGSNIAGAVAIPLNATVTGYLGQFGNNYIDGYAGEYYKVNFEAGDHVSIRVISAGNDAPCAAVYAPGTDDFNLPDANEVQIASTYNTNHWLGTFIAPTTGTFILVMNNDDEYDCAEDSSQWAYSFSVEAPHAIRLGLPAGATLVTGVNHLRVTVLNALNQNVTDPNLTIGLATQWPHTPAKQIARVHVANGIATFTFKIPANQAGNHVKLIVGAGDNVNYVETSTGRNYRID